MQNENQSNNLYYNHNYESWKNNIDSYEQQKKNLEWGYNLKPNIITEKIVKEKENVFNPITQRYNNHQFQNKIKTSEGDNRVNSIAKSFDKTIRNEQTYDIINLKDKLSGFENHPNYPKLSQQKIKKLETSRTDYNILSNITLDKHHYLSPEMRPKLPKESNEIRLSKVNVMNYKDYDIITNKYKNNHDQKSKTDYELTVLEAAKNFWNKSDFDPIKNKYINDKKEEEYQKIRIEKENNNIADAFKKSNE